jgi:hypothetical protein
VAKSGLQNWRGDEAFNRIQAVLKRRLSACAILVQNHAKRLINTEGTGVFKEEHEAKEAAAAARKK